MRAYIDSTGSCITLFPEGDIDRAACEQLAEEYPKMTVARQVTPANDDMMPGTGKIRFIEIPLPEKPNPKTTRRYLSPSDFRKHYGEDVFVGDGDRDGESFRTTLCGYAWGRAGGNWIDSNGDGWDWCYAEETE